MKIGVTGLSSEIGQAVEAHAVSMGHSVEGLGRHLGQRRFDLSEGLAPKSLVGLDAVVHLAWDRNPSVNGRDLNVESSIHLLRECKRNEMPIVFLSSSSASQPEKSHYGASKLRVELEASDLGVRALRAGLIWGRGLPPILQTLQRLASLPGLLPLPSPSMALDHNHDSHVAKALISSLTETDSRSGVRSLASPEFVTTTEILESFRSPRFTVRVPIPTRLTARTARRIRDSRLSTRPQLDSLALLDTTREKLDFDPAYPHPLGKEQLLAWLRGANGFKA